MENKLMFAILTGAGKGASRRVRAARPRRFSLLAAARPRRFSLLAAARPRQFGLLAAARPRRFGLLAAAFALALLLGVSGGGSGLLAAARPRRFSLLAAAFALALLLGVSGGGSGLLPGSAPDAGEASSHWTDYDTDDDGLIEITTLAQLDAIRYDLDGTGTISDADDAAAYLRAFPNRKTDTPNANGCDGDSDLTPTANVCIGYELMASLDFDTNGNGQADSGDAYWNGGQGWTSIGGLDIANFNAIGNYTATFNGNKGDGHSISNLYINRAVTGNSGYTLVGLFARVTGTGGVVRDVRLVNPNISITRSGTTQQAVPRYTDMGGLVGLLGSGATLTGNGVEGGTVTAIQGAGRSSQMHIGCLAGRALTGVVGFGEVPITISASYATCAVNYTLPVVEILTTSPITRDNNNGAAGGLLGIAVGAGGNGRIDIDTSYATGDVTCNGPGRKNCGGLAGETGRGTFRSNYATGNVVNRGETTIAAVGSNTACDRTGTSTTYPSRTGGLIGRVTSGGVTQDSYATGRVTSTLETVQCPYTVTGGLVGRTTLNDNGDAGTITNSYWDSVTTGLGFSGTGQPTGTRTAPSGGRTTAGARTTTQLQTPTGYATPSSGNPYATWNWDVDGDATTGDGSGNDDPWHFGTNMQYPILKFGHDAISIAHQVNTGQRVTGVDYDGDDDNLIDVTTLAQLDAIRYDLDGNGSVQAGMIISSGEVDNIASYARAFPGLTLGMGCPATCIGYELGQDLDFDSNGDGVVNATDAYPSWRPLGTGADPYGSVFRGNGYRIANLTIGASIPAGISAVGLFGVISGDDAVIESLGLTGAALTPGYAGTAADYDVGALVGYVDARSTVRACYASGTVTTMASGATAVSSVGGLVGRAGPGAKIRANYAGVAVAANSTATPPAGDDAAGGLVGRLAGAAGANGQATVTAVYATGTVSASRDDAAVGGLIGDIGEYGTVSASYWDTRSSEIADDADRDPPEGLSTVALRRPTGYSGIYASWDEVDLDGDGAGDDAWDFGTDQGYPLLKWGGHDIYKQGRPRTAAGAGEEEEYVTPPIVYNLNIRFSVRGLTLDEGESGSYQVRMSQAPARRGATVSVQSNNPDVAVAPAELEFTYEDWNEWQTVEVTVARDPNYTDESAYITHRGPRLSYGGLLVRVNDVWPSSVTETVNEYSITVREAPDAPAGVTVTAPATLDLDTVITIGAAPASAPRMAADYGFGETAAAQMAANIRVEGAPMDGLNICLPVPAALVTEAGPPRELKLLRYSAASGNGAGGWSEVAGAQRRGEAMCVDGATEYGVFAVAYVAMLPELGVVSDLGAVPGDAPGSVRLTWTPGVNATRHWIAGIKQSDTSELAVWVGASDAGAHTVGDLEGGEGYYFTITSGRIGAGSVVEWSAWADWAIGTASATPAPTPTPAPAIRPPPSPLGATQ